MVDFNKLNEARKNQKAGETLEQSKDRIEKERIEKETLAKVAEEAKKAAELKAAEEAKKGQVKDSVIDAARKAEDERRAQAAQLPAVAQNAQPAVAASASLAIKNGNGHNEPDEEGLCESDLKIPRWIIVQETTKGLGERKALVKGQFMNKLTGDSKVELTLNILQRRNGRVLFPRGDFSGKRTCWSFDGIVPDAERIMLITKEFPKCAECKTCPFRQWDDTKKNEPGKGRPDCRENITFLALDESQTPCWVIFSSLALPVIKQLLGNFELKKKTAGIKKQRFAMRYFKTTFGVRLVDDQRGTFYLPIVKKMEPMPETDFDMLDMAFEALKYREQDADLFEPEEDQVGVAENGNADIPPQSFPFMQAKA